MQMNGDDINVITRRIMNSNKLCICPNCYRMIQCSTDILTNCEQCGVKIEEVKSFLDISTYLPERILKLHVNYTNLLVEEKYINCDISELHDKYIIPMHYALHTECLVPIFPVYFLGTMDEKQGKNIVKIFQMIKEKHTIGTMFFSRIVKVVFHLTDSTELKFYDDLVCLALKKYIHMDEILAYVPLELREKYLTVSSFEKLNF